MGCWPSSLELGVNTGAQRAVQISEHRCKQCSEKLWIDDFENGLFANCNVKNVWFQQGSQQPRRISSEISGLADLMHDPIARLAQSTASTCVQMNMWHV